MLHIVQKPLLNKNNYVGSAEDRDIRICGNTARAVDSAEDSKNATKGTGTLLGLKW